MKEISRADGIKDFTDLDYIYVDKTEYIYSLVKKYKRVFFSRPRRFGKSLTLNTIGTLFEQGVEPYFKGTWVYDKWNLGTFPVLRLNFLDYTTKDLNEFKRQLCDALSDAARHLRLEEYLADKEPNVCMRRLLEALHQQSVVILIDEYDHQMTANINDSDLYEEFRSCIREFYGAMKTKEQIRFLAVTGVTRLKDVTIFSVGSDIEDLSYDHAYSQMIGFTREEIKHFYDDYLRLGVSYEHTDVRPEDATEAQIDDLLDRMAYHYDGFCFDRKYQNKVYSTWSVNHFLRAISSDEEVEFGDYWYDAGGVPSILANYMESHNLDVSVLQQSKLLIPYNDFQNPTSLISINERVLMCQTGYLTLKGRIDRNLDVALGFANREVSSALCSLMCLKFLTHKVSPYLSDSREFVLEKGTASQIIDHLNTLLAAVVYDNYPIKEESMLRLLFQIYFKGADLDVRTEQHNSKGRSDLLVLFKKRCVVLELKFSQDGSDARTLLNDAVRQITERDYGREETTHGRKLLRIAAVFSAAKDERKITLWQEVAES